MAQPIRYVFKDGRTVRWKVRYRTPDGRSTDKGGFTTKRQALLWQAELLLDGRKPERTHSHDQRTRPDTDDLRERPTTAPTEKLVPLQQGDVLTPSEAAGLTGISEDDLANLRTGGRGPLCVMLGGRVRYLRRDIDAYVGANALCGATNARGIGE
jgi:hypothetical protein